VDETPRKIIGRADPVVRRDQRMLLLSVVVSAAFAVVSSVWGILSGSSMIVFDGLYSFVSVGLSMMAMVGLRFARRGPDQRYPWGREAVEPLVVVLKAATLGGLCLYAAVGGVIDLTRGGRDVAIGSALIYAVIATVAGLGVGLVLRTASRRPGSSDLVRAEAAEWLGDSLLSVGVLVGFLVAAGLVRAGREDLAAYVDPAMVVVISTFFLWIPVRMIIGALQELMAKSPSVQVMDQLQECIGQVQREFGLEESFLRAAKVGGRMDIEIGFVVGDDSDVRTVRDCDVVRQDVHDRLAGLGFERSLVVAFTSDRRWVV
jgi:cation diffusion facilitator family transporter